MLLYMLLEYMLYGQTNKSNGLIHIVTQIDQSSWIVQLYIIFLLIVTVGLQ